MEKNPKNLSEENSSFWATFNDKRDEWNGTNRQQFEEDGRQNKFR